MSVKVGSGQINSLQQSLLELQKIKITEAKKEIFELKSDKKEISEDALNLKNIDAEKSEIVNTAFLIDFNFVYASVAQAELRIKGFIRKEEKTLEVEFTYMFQREIPENNKIVSKTFLLNLKMKAGYGEQISSGKKLEKEDILKFIQRLTNEIFDTFNDYSKSLRQIIINERDLREIAKVGKDDLARVVQSLLGAVFSFIKYKEMESWENSKVVVLLYPEPEIHEAKEFIVTNLQSFSMEILQLDSPTPANE